MNDDLSMRNNDKILFQSSNFEIGSSSVPQGGNISKGNFVISKEKGCWKWMLKAKGLTLISDSSKLVWGPTVRVNQGQRL